MAIEPAAKKPADTTAKTEPADERTLPFHGAACGAGAGGSVIIHEARPRQPTAKAP
ncbi:hypothetical protein [Roseomonas genomospecies 6]|uniref:hypothetical protein n=1 Tax=Roseomonas genomospecies 6 TaxID=214106 RepID=UPI00142EDA9A|nr:hypothetical protein [Roseomonas genomospecies 6]